MTGPGVYVCERGTDSIGIIVAGQVPEEPHNALSNLFSASAERVDYGAEHYEQRSRDTSSLLLDLLGDYKGEGIVVAYTMSDYRRDRFVKQFEELTPEERRRQLQELSPELQREILHSLSPELQRELLESLSPDVRWASLRNLPLQERLAGVSPKEITEYLKTLKAQRAPRKGKPRRKD